MDPLLAFVALDEVVVSVLGVCLSADPTEVSCKVRSLDLTLLMLVMAVFANTAYVVVPEALTLLRDSSEVLPTGHTIDAIRAEPTLLRYRSQRRV